MNIRDIQAEYPNLCPLLSVSLAMVIFRGVEKDKKAPLKRELAVSNANRLRDYIGSLVNGAVTAGD